MSEITKLPALPEGRPETGPMQFGDDWPGVFIRGDNALFDARAVEAALKFVPAERWDIASMLRGLAQTLNSCSVGDTGWPPAPPVEQAKTEVEGCPIMQGWKGNDPCPSCGALAPWYDSSPSCPRDP